MYTLNRRFYPLLVLFFLLATTQTTRAQWGTWGSLIVTPANNPGCPGTQAILGVNVICQNCGTITVNYTGTDGSSGSIDIPSTTNIGNFYITLPNASVTYTFTATSPIEGLSPHTQTHSYEQRANFTSAGVIGTPSPSSGACCVNPGTILSISNPSGGYGANAVYQWQYSTNGSLWLNIAGATGPTYNPPTTCITRYYRRAARRNCTSYPYLYSNSIMVSVTQNITNGGSISGTDETECSAYNPSYISGSYLGSNVEYAWYANDVYVSSGMNYDPPTISTTTIYTRKARNIGCSTWVNSSGSVTKEVATCESNAGSECDVVGEQLFFEDFGSGAGAGPSLPPGTTTYNYGSIGGGNYVVTNTTGLNGSLWHNAPDHTPDDVNGYCLLFDASSSPGVFYSQTFDSLCANTTYNFSCYAANIVSPSACGGNSVEPDLKFRLINPTTMVEIGSITTGGISTTATMTWNQYSISFSTGANQEEVLIEVTNNASGGCGNDFVIDDFSFNICNPSSEQEFDICDLPSGEIQVGAEVYSTPGTYETIIDLPNSCNDSIVYTTLVASNTIYTEESVTLCNGNSIIINGEVISNAGIYIDTLQASGACDSIVTINLSISEAATNTINETVCGTYTSPSGLYSWTSSGIYQDTIQTLGGCDSILTINLTVSDLVGVEVSASTNTVCSGTAVTLTASGAWSYTWSNGLDTGSTNIVYPSTSGYYYVTGTISGCSGTDSVFVTVDNCCWNVTSPGIISGNQVNCGSYNPAYIASAASASGGSGLLQYQWQYSLDNITWYDIPGATNSSYDPDVISSTTYYRRGAKRGNCSSYVYSNTVTKIVDSSVPISDATILHETICDGNSYTSPSGLYNWTSSGTYQDTIQTSGGCDSIIIVNLTVSGSVTNTINETVCGTYTSPSGLYNWASSGIYQDTMQTSGGCDSILTINLTISGTVTSTINETECENYTSPSGLYNWASSGIYQDTVQTLGGCDSIITINLTISGTTTNTINETVCGTYTSPSGLYSWTNSGVYQDTIQTQGGCDSILTINLTVLTSSNAIVHLADCSQVVSPSGQYTWTSTGLYQDTLINNLGCDSIITVNVSISDGMAIASVDVQAITCAGTETGSATVMVNGGLPPYTYNWEVGTSVVAGATITNIGAGSYPVVINDSIGCSIHDTIHLNDPELLVHQSVEDTLACSDATDGTVSIVVSGGTSPYSYNWANVNTNQATITALSPGDYSVTVTDAYGCEIIDMVSVVAPNPITYEVLVEDVSCHNENDGYLQLSNINGGTPPYQCSVNGLSMSTDSALVNLSGGMYTIQVQDANNCSYSLTETILEPDPIHIQILSGQDIDMGESVQLTSTIVSTSEILSYEWLASDSTLSCYFCEEPIAMPIETTIYTLLVTDEYDCTAKAQTTINVAEEYLVYIPNVFSPNGDGENDNIGVLGGKGIESVVFFEIYSRWGEKVFSIENPSFDMEADGWDGSFKGQNLKQDVYTYVAKVYFVNGHSELLTGDITLLRD